MSDSAAQIADTAGTYDPVGNPPVPAPLKCCGPDLIVATTTASSVTIRNIGNVPANAYKCFFTFCYKGFLVYVSAGSVQLCSVKPILTLVPGLYSGRSVTINIPLSNTSRAVSVDSGSSVVEIDERNNSGIIPGANIAC